MRAGWTLAWRQLNFSRSETAHCTAKFQRSLICNCRQHAFFALRAALMRTRRLNYERKTVFWAWVRCVCMLKGRQGKIYYAHLSLPSHHRRPNAAWAHYILTHTFTKRRPLYSSHLLLAIIFFSLTTHFSHSFRPHRRGARDKYLVPFPVALFCPLHMLSWAFSSHSLWFSVLFFHMCAGDVSLLYFLRSPALNWLICSDL